MRVAFALLILLVIAAMAYGNSIGHSVAIVIWTLLGVGAGAGLHAMIARDWVRILRALEIADD